MSSSRGLSAGMDAGTVRSPTTRLLCKPRKPIRLCSTLVGRIVGSPTWRLRSSLIASRRSPRSNSGASTSCDPRSCSRSPSTSCRNPTGTRPDTSAGRQAGCRDRCATASERAGRRCVARGAGVSTGPVAQTVAGSRAGGGVGRCSISAGSGAFQRTMPRIRPPASSISSIDLLRAPIGV